QLRLRQLPRVHCQFLPPQPVPGAVRLKVRPRPLLLLLLLALLRLPLGLACREGLLPLLARLPVRAALLRQGPPGKYPRHRHPPTPTAPTSHPPPGSPLAQRQSLPTAPPGRAFVGSPRSQRPRSSASSWQSG